MLFLCLCVCVCVCVCVYICVCYAKWLCVWSVSSFIQVLLYNSIAHVQRSKKKKTTLVTDEDEKEIPWKILGKIRNSSNKKFK